MKQSAYKSRRTDMLFSHNIKENKMPEQNFILMQTLHRLHITYAYFVNSETVM